VGSGSTEMTILNNGEVELTRVLSLGSVRLPEQVSSGKKSNESVQRVLRRSIHEIAEYAAREHSLCDIDTFIALGADVRFAARNLLEEKIEGNAAQLSKGAFLKFIDKLAKMSAEETASQFGLTYAEAETLFPALLFYANFLNETKAENLLVPMVSIRDGLLLEMAQMLSGYKRTDISRQVIHSAKRLGRKYKYDEAHSLCVAQLAVKLFDLLKEEHGLGTRERLLLETSAVLHDIGMYISAVSHHKHSSYLVDAAEIFGLRKADKGIVSNVVRYHRRSSPMPSHVPYMSLPRLERAVVSKLAAMLRVADCLDKSHQQKIRNFTLEKERDNCILWIQEEGDFSLEREGLVKKGGMFADVFGFTVVLKQGAPAKS